MPGLCARLDALESAAIPKAVATSSGRAFVDEVLGRFELGNRFSFILASEDVTHGKPDPEIYRRAADRFDISTGQMLVLEDSQTGLTAAISSGARAVAVPGAHSVHHDFSKAIWIASSLNDPKIYALLSLPKP